MRPGTLLLVAWSVFLLSAQVAGAAGPAGGNTPTGNRQLSYTDCSDGLTPSLGGSITEVAVGDVNHDGHPDLVSVGNHANPGLSPDDQHGAMSWLGDGACHWTWVHCGEFGYGGCDLGDADGDGTIDIAYGIHHNYGDTDLGDQLLEVTLGDGTGRFCTPWDDGLGTHGEDWGMFSTRFGDFDEDADLDVVSIGFGGAEGGFQVYLNEQDGTWRRSFGFLGGNTDNSMEVGDIDNDGHLDIVAGKQQGTVWLGDGEGFFVVSDEGLPDFGEYCNMRGVSLGDLNRDGRDDIAFCHCWETDTYVFLRRADGTWQDVSNTVPQTGHCDYTEIVDMDGDGLLDLVTFGRGWLHVYGGDGTGIHWTPLSGFQADPSTDSAEAFRVSGDLDLNGRPDPVTVGGEYHAWQETTPPSTLRVRVTRPTIGKKLLAGQMRWIEWAVESPSGDPGSVTLELSTSGPGGPWQEIASGLPDSRRYEWRVPAVTCDDCRIRVTVTTADGTASGVSPDPFTIARRPDPVTVRFEDDKETLAWTDSLARDRWNVYRSSWERFRETGEYTQDPATEPAAARMCDREETRVTDDFVPEPGRMVFYLVTGYHLRDDGTEPGTPVPMGEGPLGQDSAAHMRRNSHRCGP